MIVQLAKKSLIQICHVLKQNKGYAVPNEIDDSNIKSTMLSKRKKHFMTLIFSGKTLQCKKTHNFISSSLIEIEGWVEVRRF